MYHNQGCYIYFYCLQPTKIQNLLSEKLTKVFTGYLFAIFKPCLLNNYLLKFAPNSSNVFSTDDLGIHWKIIIG